MTTTAPFRSILYDRPADAAKSTDPSVLADLNLDQVFAAVAAGWDEYDLMPFFSAPLHDVQGVGYRHQILRDMEDEALSGAPAAIACSRVISSRSAIHPRSAGQNEHVAAVHQCFTGRPSTIAQA